MTLVRLDPSRELEAFQTDMNRLFDTFFRSDNGSSVRRWVPPTDLTEDGDDMVMKLDLPGLSEEDVTVEVEGNVLTVSGERRDEREEKDGNVFRTERSYGKFSRSFTIPEGTDPEQIRGAFDKGVLELRIPKPAEQKPHRIQIGSGDGGKKAIEGTAKAA